MSKPVNSNGVDNAESRMPSFWLPPDTRGNGLAAQRWAELIVVTREHAEQLLDAFRVAGVPACMATRHDRSGAKQDTRIWVDPDHYGGAEDVLLREMSR